MTPGLAGSFMKLARMAGYTADRQTIRWSDNRRFTTYPDGICPPGTPVSNDLLLLTGSFNDEHND